MKHSSKLVAYYNNQVPWLQKHTFFNHALYITHALIFFIIIYMVILDFCVSQCTPFHKVGPELNVRTIPNVAATPSAITTMSANVCTATPTTMSGRL